MKEIKIYHSLWKQLLIVAGCLAFGIGGAFMSGAIGWLCIILFGGGGIVILYLTVIRERLGNIPYLIITDERLVINQGKGDEVRFEDVEHFELLSNGTNNKMIGIYYKGGVKPNSGMASRFFQQMNKDIASGAQACVPADGLSVSSEQLLDLLNERLQFAK